MGKWLKTEELADGVIYLRFDGFDRQSRRWLSDQLKAHRNAPAVIVDLRNNLGGSAFSLEITLGEFFPRHVSWGQFSKRAGDWTDVDTWQWGSARYPGKVALLVSGLTASSGEILAHALQYHRRAVLVGRKTSGRVIGAAAFKLPDGGSVQVGAWDYHSLDGKQIDGVGVTPDVAVESPFGSYAELRAGFDADIAAALAALRTPPAASASHATSAAGDGRVQ
jgi:carboxyl-terminal processing protease